MKQNQGSIVPVVALVVLLLLGVGLYMMGRNTTMDAGNTAELNSEQVSSEAGVQSEADTTASERATWITYANTENGYSISYPTEWARGGTGDAVILTGATNLRVEIEATDLAASTTLAAFANTASGNTFARTLTTLNGREALQSVEDLNTTYYVMSGNTGYQITVKNPGVGTENTALIQEVLRSLTFTR